MIYIKSMEAQIKIITRQRSGELVAQPMGRAFKLEERVYRVGRGPEGDIRVQKGWLGAKCVSRKHLELEVYSGEGQGYITRKPARWQLSDEGVQLTNLESTNGTGLELFVRGTKEACRRLGTPRLANGYRAEEFGPGDGVRIWLGGFPDELEQWETAVVLDIFDSRPSVHLYSEGFGRLSFGEGPEKVGFAP